MKVLFIGVYRDGTGYSEAAKNYILAMDHVGIDVVPRPLKLNDSHDPIHPRLVELEKKNAEGCNVVIQHALPHHMDYNGQFDLNIGLFAWETSHFRNSAWPERLNCMDAAWVINDQMVRACQDSGVTVPIEVVPHCFDIAEYQRNYKQLPHLNQYNNDFLFYFVGEFIRRKNLAALVKAFHAEFLPNEPVQLVIKTNRAGLSPDQCKVQVEQFCEEIKKGLKLPDLKQEVIITDRLSREQMLQLHASCDCHVCPSYGEAFSQPTFDAMAMGRAVIAPGHGGFTVYLNSENSWVVDGQPSIVFGINDTFEDLYTGNETWFDINTVHLKQCMREAYSNHKLRSSKCEAGVLRSYDFSYQEIGNQIKGLLTDGLTRLQRLEGGERRCTAV